MLKFESFSPVTKLLLIDQNHSIESGLITAFPIIQALPRLTDDLEKFAHLEPVFHQGNLSMAI
jgi:hypothetical protein